MELSDEGDFLLAIERYTDAITLNKNNHVLFSNRSAAYARVGKFSEALEDAQRCHELKLDWPKVRGIILSFVIVATGQAKLNISQVHQHVDTWMSTCF